ncbi:MinD/ParA family protein [Streptomyces sp. NPDC091376]|uniref:MinD/ParA family ATP-binding protein n=1 Tax=Streptomyces sp. NPDC091376 TaxID=3365994 RepID=UPI00381E17C1
MAVIALAGCSGAPGVTTTALALLLTWPIEPGRRMILAECDPDGGAVLHGLLQGTLGDRYGLRNLSVAARKGELKDAFWRQLVDLSSEDGKQEAPRDRLLLPGLTDPAQAAGLGPVWEPLADMVLGIDALSTDGHDVLIDLGRSGAFGPSAVLAQRADALIVVVRNTLRCLQAAQARIEALEERIGHIGLVVIDEGPYPAGEVQRVLRVPVVATLPYAPKEARVLSDGAEQPRNFARSALMKAARTASTVLVQRAVLRKARLAPRTAGPDGGQVAYAR